MAALKAAIAGAQSRRPLRDRRGRCGARRPCRRPAGRQVAATGRGGAACACQRAPALAAQIPAGAPLFVFVRFPGQPGPPVAVKRLQAALPQLVELTPADAMMGGRGFAAGDKVEVTARIALGGQPTASPGDPFGQLGYDVGRDGEKELVIDRLTP